MKALKSCLRQEPVLCASALCALLSFFFLPPSRETLAFPDYRVLSLLFCLIQAVVFTMLLSIYIEEAIEE